MLSFGLFNWKVIIDINFVWMLIWYVSESAVDFFLSKVSWRKDFYIVLFSRTPPLNKLPHPTENIPLPHLRTLNSFAKYLYVTTLDQMENAESKWFCNTCSCFIGQCFNIHVIQIVFFQKISMPFTLRVFGLNHPHSSGFL